MKVYSEIRMQGVSKLKNAHCDIMNITLLVSFIVK